MVHALTHALPTEAPAEVSVVAREDDLREVLGEAARAPRIAVDVEACGMFAYRARACIVQLAWDDARRIVVVDALATSIAPLAGLLGPDGPVKILHDVAFDARLLAEHGVSLGNVHDTALAAHMLGRRGTGLAALLASELGVPIGKALQQHDWRVRPLDGAMLRYLASDVAHLEPLERKLWGELESQAILDAVLEETTYRLACAVDAGRTPPAAPPYMRVKGASRLSERDLAALRVAAELREAEAQRRDVPPHKVASNDALIAIARARPVTAEAVARIGRVATGSPVFRAFVSELVQALSGAPDRLPDHERAHFLPERLPATVARARREREARLLSWRRAEAALRHVGEQVVLPGHCLRDAVDADVASPSELAMVPGIGSFRVRRDGEAIVHALRGDGAPP
jgi:ribonuclease D